MSDRKGGFGAFLFGVVLGAVAGFMFAPEGGEGTRRRVGRGLRNLKTLAEEKVGEVRGLLKEVSEDDDEDEEPEAEDEAEEEAELTTREQLRRRLEAARRRRAAGRKEEEEPLA
jgi:gas vesicle protein